MAKRSVDSRKRLGKRFYNRDTLVVAEDLLGKLLVRRLDDGQRLSGIIVEVEAYLHQGDPASHSYRGQTQRNASMFGAAGKLYVYTIHAKFCVNVVTEPMEVGAAVLVRAIEPLEGISHMRHNRSTIVPQLISTGPARLCQALAIDKSIDGEDLLTGDMIWLESQPTLVTSKPFAISSSPRIGISQAKDLPYRFFVTVHGVIQRASWDLVAD